MFPFLIFLVSDEIWVIISVEVTGTLAITQQMSSLNQLGKTQTTRDQDRQMVCFQGLELAKTISIIHSDLARYSSMSFDSVI